MYSGTHSCEHILFWTLSIFCFGVRVFGCMEGDPGRVLSAPLAPSLLETDTSNSLIFESFIIGLVLLLGFIFVNCGYLSDKIIGVLDKIIGKYLQDILMPAYQCLLFLMRTFTYLFIYWQLTIYITISRHKNK